MILLIPVSPEVPRKRAPKIWPGLLFALILGIVYLECHEILAADYKYIDSLSGLVETTPNGKISLRPEAHNYLKLRPLLRLVPSRGDWDWTRLLMANFIHGSFPHVLLNAVGIFAGARICTTFLPFSMVFLIFLVGGTLGLLTSTLFTSQLSLYIPHLGASAGIFALMGTYYVFNFKYRTKYFFWFPSRKGLVALRTSWFFFVDVILLEIVLSAAQLFPGQGDVVDHFAHVVGFAVGVLLAIGIRFVRAWPSYLQTRGEVLYYRHRLTQGTWLSLSAHEKWMELLEINRFNDQLKLRLFQYTGRFATSLTDADIERILGFLSPTFMRNYTKDSAECIRAILKAKRTLPKSWLLSTPYDCVISVARFLAVPQSEQAYLFEYVSSYRHAHPEGGDLEKKLQPLLQRLSLAIGSVQETSYPEGDTATSSNTLQLNTEGSLAETAKLGSGSNQR